MMRFEQLHSLQGVLMRAFFVYDGAGRTMALGAVPQGSSPGFCVMKARRYERDLPRVAAVERLCGVPVRRHRYSYKGRKRVVEVAA